MEAASIHIARPPSYEPTGSPERGTVRQLRPLQQEEGVSYPEADVQLGASLPYELEVADWSRPKYVHDKQVGEIATSIVTLSDDSRYVFRKFVPLKQRWETSVDFSDPLATRVDGFNTYMGRKLAQAGIHSRIVGTNQQHGFDLMHDAQAMFVILDEDDRRQQEPGELTSAAGESVGMGYSMGQMKFLLGLVLAPKMNREIPFSTGIDPCLADKVDYKKELLEPGHLLGLARYLGREALELPLNFAKNLVEERNPAKTLRRSVHLAQTVGIMPAYTSNVVDKWKVVATGETGQYLPQIPKEAVLVIHFFNGSYFNDDELYKKALADHPHFRSINEDGVHLSAVDPRVVRRMVQKVALGMELRDQGVKPDELADALSYPILKAAA